MTAPNPLPEYVYKIGTDFPSETSPNEALPLSDLDRKDGFIHLSTASQVPSTVGRFFSSSPQITLLKIRLESIAHKMRWDESRGHGVFPHVYGDLLSSDVADRKVYKAEDPAHYGWEALLRADGEWLV